MENGEEVQSERTIVSGGESNVLNSVGCLKICHNDPQVRGLQHMSVAECANHLHLKGLLADEMTGRVGYISVLEVSTMHLFSLT